MHLSGLFIYPVKSLAGYAVAAAEVDALGLVSDRRFLVVDEEGRFLTQRTLPRMALVQTGLRGDTLLLSAPGHGAIEVRPTLTTAQDAYMKPVSVWQSEGLLADDCGDEPAKWLSAFLAVNCRLVRVGGRFRRETARVPATLATSRPRDAHLVGFADAFPFLIVSEASLADLNDRLVAQHNEALPMNRFRPNLVVAGCSAFAEDTWRRFRVGDVVFHAAGPCARCVMTTTDQETAQRGKEPLRTLALYRRDAREPSEVNFGQNLIHETKRGTLRVGDAVEVLE